MKSKPLLFITGFLGTGKTTLLRELILEMKSRGYRADVILNDFANAEIDAATLDSSAASIAPIAASCACCESLDELVALCQTAAAAQGDFLLIELNGTADPLSLLEAFTLIESKIPFFPRMQVCTIDVRLWGLRGDLKDLEVRQLETAAFWRPTHRDEVSEASLDVVRREVQTANPQAEEKSVRQLADDLERELGQEVAFREGSVAVNSAKLSEAEKARQEDTIHRLSHRFSGVQVTLPNKVRRGSIERLLNGLPPWVLRAKALVKLVEEPGSRWLFERSGTDPVYPPIEVPGISRVAPSLVCIGAKLDPEEIEEQVRRQFGGVKSSVGT
ncbi:MAG: molybdopterin-guanine dinucleotide biosynthesis protein MobB [Verrucomicrobiota bacterium]